VQSLNPNFSFSAKHSLTGSIKYQMSNLGESTLIKLHQREVITIKFK